MKDTKLNNVKDCFFTREELQELCNKVDILSASYSYGPLGEAYKNLSDDLTHLCSLITKYESISLSTISIKDFKNLSIMHEEDNRIFPNDVKTKYVHINRDMKTKQEDAKIGDNVFVFEVPVNLDDDTSFSQTTLTVRVLVLVE